ncbi:hypothetical protein DMA11_10340 [Marinilabiliaceae bacterium JC017]|nr:hypothetical protein DMA11_10340 [Marinilabiliaceae bacterium JC017]
MNEQLIIDLITYFGKFPTREAVLNLFNRSNSNFPGYEPLKTAVAGMDPHSLLPGITGFVVGVNEEVIKKHISGFKGIYLFIDYGSINIERDELQRENGAFNLAATLAYPYNPNEHDSIEAILLAQQTLELLRSIRKRMLDDQRCGVPWLKDITFPQEISPWYSRELHNSTGWTMVFQKKGIELV